jgi:hypothetical protein
MYPSFGNRDSLLLHSFVDSGLIFGVHLIKLVNAADSIISQHQRTGLNAVLTSL